MQQPLYAIVGPTASGKSDLAVALAHALDGEVVSADSMQIYQGLDIGSAKVTAAEMDGVPHHLLDFLPPEAAYNAALFQRDALAAIQDIQRRGKAAILCGGTGLYVNAVLYPMDFTGASHDPAVRQALEARLAAEGPEALHAALRAVDPTSAGRLTPSNTRRVIRALEVHALTGRPMSSFDSDSYQSRAFRFTPTFCFGLDWPRDVLEARIRLRVRRMLEGGLLEEVQALRARGLTSAHQSMQGLGYKEILAYLEGEGTLAQAEEAICVHTRQFAKRQMTWFRREKRILWLPGGQPGAVDVCLRHIRMASP